MEVIWSITYDLYNDTCIYQSERTIDSSFKINLLYNYIEKLSQGIIANYLASDKYIFVPFSCDHLQIHEVDQPYHSKNLRNFHAGSEEEYISISSNVKIRHCISNGTGTTGKRFRVKYEVVGTYVFSHYKMIPEKKRLHCDIKF